MHYSKSPFCQSIGTLPAFHAALKGHVKHITPTTSSALNISGWILCSLLPTMAISAAGVESPGRSESVKCLLKRSHIHWVEIPQALLSILIILGLLASSSETQHPIRWDSAKDLWVWCSGTMCTYEYPCIQTSFQGLFLAYAEIQLQFTTCWDPGGFPRNFDAPDCCQLPQSNPSGPFCSCLPLKWLHLTSPFHHDIIVSQQDGSTLPFQADPSWVMWMAFMVETHLENATPSTGSMSGSR